MKIIKSRPIKLRRLEPFAICAVSIRSGCDPRLLRILKPTVYYLNDWITLKGKDDDEVAQLNQNRQLDTEWFGKYITVQAIVGKNGSGKSSLLDMVYRIINNFGIALARREDELEGNGWDKNNGQIALDDEEDNIYPAYVSGVDACLYFVNGERIGCIHCLKDKVFWNFESESIEIGTVNKTTTYRR